MTHYIAILLFEAGQIQTFLYLILALHLFLFRQWRGQPTLQLRSVGWLVCFVILSILFLFFSDGLERIGDSIGYNYSHLYRGEWTDQEAIANLLLTWRNVLLPIYVPWLAVWVAGLVIVGVSAKQSTTIPSSKATSTVASITLTLSTMMILMFGWLVGQ